MSNSKMSFKLYGELFLTFMKIGAMAFGGGYAILPILEKELVEKKKWISKKQLVDFFAISQCLPGVIASNVAVFIGCKKGNRLGGIVSALGVVFPSFIVISIIAAVLSEFSHIAAIQDAFVAIRACVCVLIIKSIINLWKTSIIDIFSFLIFAAVTAGSLYFDITPIIFIVLAGVAGVLITYIRGKGKHDSI